QSREKGTVDLLLAVQETWKRGVPAHVVLAGPEMPNFRAFWPGFEASLSAEERSRVHRLGVVSGTAKRDFFAGIGLFSLPSRSDSFGLALLEAWANGKPVVGYRAGGVADLIHDGRDGLLTPCGDLNALAHALETLCNSAETRETFGAAGHRRIGMEYRWEDKLE